MDNAVWMRACILLVCGKVVLSLSVHDGNVVCLGSQTCSCFLHHCSEIKQMLHLWTCRRLQWIQVPCPTHYALWPTLALHIQPFAKNTFSVSSTQVCSSPCLLQKLINVCRLWRSLVGMSFFQVCWLQTFFSQLLPWFIVEKLTISSLLYVQALISALHWPVLFILGCRAFEI